MLEILHNFISSFRILIYIKKREKLVYVDMIDKNIYIYLMVNETFRKIDFYQRKYLQSGGEITVCSVLKEFVKLMMEQF